MAPALISLDITPKTPADHDKLARALRVLAAEDAELRVSPGVERSCTVIGATSEAHLEGIVDRLKRENMILESVIAEKRRQLAAARCPDDTHAMDVRFSHFVERQGGEMVRKARWLARIEQIARGDQEFARIVESAADGATAVLIRHRGAHALGGE